MYDKILIVYDDHSMKELAKLFQKLILQKDDTEEQIVGVKDGDFQCEILSRDKWTNERGTFTNYKVIFLSTSDYFRNYWRLSKFETYEGFERQVSKIRSKYVRYNWSGDIAYIKFKQIFDYQDFRIRDEMEEEFKSLSNKVKKLMSKTQTQSEYKEKTDVDLKPNEIYASGHVFRRAAGLVLSVAAPPLIPFIAGAELLNSLVIDGKIEEAKHNNVNKHNSHKLEKGIRELAVIHFYLNSLYDFMYK